ncbi:MAG: xanthine phosphoribosyltransferase [Coriobacteriia bacterium]|nr:xanthine phosphoribosyltransferase [Coriobacteriia bacterium]
MKILEDRIKSDGIVTDHDILKVDSFINHQIDSVLYDQMADEFIKIFKDKKITKVLTIETSGIAIAYAVAHKLNLPFVFAKKTESINLHGDVFSSKIVSYTHFREYDVIVSKKFLQAGDHVLILDDFLANGSALRGLLSICAQAEATVEGIGILIEKTFQRGGRELREKGYQIESLAKIKSISENKIEFN